MKDYCGIILDLDMPIMGGLEACERIIKSYGDFDNVQSGSIIPILSRKGDDGRLQRHGESMSPTRQEIEKKKRLNTIAMKYAKSEVRMVSKVETVKRKNSLKSAMLKNSCESEEIKEGSLLNKEDDENMISIGLSKISEKDYS